MRQVIKDLFRRFAPGHFQCSPVTYGDVFRDHEERLAESSASVLQKRLDKATIVLLYIITLTREY
jgi:hypothetical protein